MPIVDFTLYDTWVPSTTANSESILFQIPQGGDTTHNEQFTNMRGAGSLPSSENFELRKVSIIPDQKIAVADIFNWMTGGLLDFQLNNVSLFKGPLQNFLDRAGWGGTLLMGTAADNAALGVMGEGFHIDPSRYITIGGGMNFRVRMLQGQALSAGTNIKVVLRGMYSIAG